MASTSQSMAPGQKAIEKVWRGFELDQLPEVGEGVALLGRIGHLAKGLVYFIVGFLAFRLAIGAGGEITGARGAIREIGQQPFGRILLGLTSAGLIAYTIWRLVQAALDTEGQGKDIKGIVIRTGYTISGLVYFGLGCFAGARALGVQSAEGGPSTGQGLLATAPGQAAVAVAGLVIIGLAFFFFQQAYQAKFMRKYDWAAMGPRLRTAALYIGRAGLATRGVAFALIGWFLFSAVIQGVNNGEISGLSDALAAIAAQTYGKILLGLTGFGLMCYAVHMFLVGWYRRFNVPRGM